MKDETARSGQATSILGQSWPLVLLIIGTPTLAVWLLTTNGALDAGVVRALGDPGQVTIRGLPIARGVRDAGAALTVGCLVLAATVAPPRPSSGLGDLGRAQVRLLTAAAIAGFAWVWSSTAVLVFSYSQLSGRPLTTPGLLSEVFDFAFTFEGGRLLGTHALMASLATIVALFARSVSQVGAAAVLALVALWPLALTGHAAGATSHDTVVNLQFVHIAAAAVWIGGLAALFLVRRTLADDLVSIVGRYSTLAGWCFAALLVSGVVGVLSRFDDLSALRSTYGALVLIKGVVLGLLGLAGWRQRKRIIPALAIRPRDLEAEVPFGRLAAFEIALMTLAMGAAAALAATPPPASDRVQTAAESLLGHPMPDPLTAGTWFSAWRLDTFWTPLALVAAIAYLVGARRLKQRGDTWPWGRTAMFLLGVVALVWSTSGPPGVYGDVLFSMHMVQHMTIATAVPTFLVLGAPVTLALRTLPRRADGSRGAREWLFLLVHSRVARVVSSPLVAAGLFIVGLVAFYYSGLFELSMRSHTAHLVMVGHFLLTGYLFANVIVGIDPGVRRPPFPLRMLLVMMTFGFHALFSVSLMSSTTVLAQTWFSALDRAWGRSLADDQYLGASLGWALGDYPLAILAGGLIVAWARADRREGRRLDREADRGGDAALRSYNAYLGGLGGHSPRGSADAEGPET